MLFNGFLSAYTLLNLSLQFTLSFYHPKDSQLPFLHCVKPMWLSLTCRVVLSFELPTGTLNTLPKHPNLIKLFTRSPRQLSNCAAKKKIRADSQPLNSGLKKRFGAKLSLDSLPIYSWQCEKHQECRERTSFPQPAKGHINRSSELLLSWHGAIRFQGSLKAVLVHFVLPSSAILEQEKMGQLILSLRHQEISHHFTLVDVLSASGIFRTVLVVHGAAHVCNEWRLFHISNP